MTGFFAEYYLWLKAVHIISIVVWMAGLLYLPRLFAAHTQVEAGSEADGTFVALESKLFSSILNPGAIVVFALGILLIIVTGAGSPGSGAWMHAKILLALLLAVASAFGLAAALYAGPLALPELPGSELGPMYWCARKMAPPQLPPHRLLHHCPCARQAACTSRC